MHRIAQKYFRLSATDLDQGVNAVVSYEILSGNDAGFVRIDPNSGAVFVEQFTTMSYAVSTTNLIIAASDAGSPRLTTLLKFKVNSSIHLFLIKYRCFFS